MRWFVARLSCALLITTLLSVPKISEACGPGLHVVEADGAFALIAEANPEWQNIWDQALQPATMLHLGSISPDLQNAMPTIGFGHGVPISYCLMDRAAETQDPDLILFALGHLTHNAADPACETFIQNALFSSAPIGMLNVFAGFDDQKGETEGIFETYGDLLFGDWDAVIDVLYDIWLDGPEAKAATNELLTWYCENGKVCANKPNINCAAVLVEAAQTLATADQYLGGMSRVQAKQFLNTLISQPLEDLLDFATGGLLQEFLGDDGGMSDEFDSEILRLKSGPLADENFWNYYPSSPMVELGPQFSLGFFNAKPSSPSFPTFDPKAMASGNILSLFQFADEDFAVTPGLLVDGLWWKNGNANTTTTVAPADNGTEFSATIRFFFALPFEGTVSAVVRKDLPGLDTSDDPVMGEFSAEFTMDPNLYPETPRQSLTVPFVVDTEDALGFYLELYVDDSLLPHFSTNFDEVWTCGNLNVNRPVIYNNFDTYGHWPSSLPVAGVTQDGGILFVRAAAAPFGAGVEGAVISCESDLLPPVTAPSNGTAVHEEVPPGNYTFTVAAPGFYPSQGASLEAVAGEKRHLTFLLDGEVAVDQTAPYMDSHNVQLSWNVDHFAPQVKSMQAQVISGDGDAEAILVDWFDVDSSGQWDADLSNVLLDGQPFHLELQPTYVNDELGRVSSSDVVIADESAPAISVEAVQDIGGLECLAEEADAPYRPMVLVNLEITDEHSPVATLQWSDDEGGTWNDQGIAETLEVGTNLLTLEVPEKAQVANTFIWVRSGNLANVISEPVTVTMPVLTTDDVCQVPIEITPDAEEIVEEPDTTTTQDQVGEDLTAEDAVEGVDNSNKNPGTSSGGCSSNPQSTPAGSLPFALMTLLFGWILWRGRGAILRRWS